MSSFLLPNGMLDFFDIVKGTAAPQYEEGLLRTGIFRELVELPENGCRCLPERGRSTWPVKMMAYFCPGRCWSTWPDKITAFSFPDTCW